MKRWLLRYGEHYITITFLEKLGIITNVELQDRFKIILIS